MNYNEYFDGFVNDEDDASCILHHWEERHFNVLYPMFGVDELAENQKVDVEVIIQSLHQWLIEKEDSLRAYMAEAGVK